MSSENLTGVNFDDLKCHWFPVSGSLMCCTSLGWRLCFATMLWKGHNNPDQISWCLLFLHYADFSSQMLSLSKHILSVKNYFHSFVAGSSFYLGNKILFFSVFMGYFHLYHYRDLNITPNYISLNTYLTACNKWWCLYWIPPALSLSDRSWPIFRSTLWAKWPKIALA